MKNKPITSETNVEFLNNASSVGFNKPTEFDNLIKARGFEVLYDKALRCPCVSPSSGNASTLCINCGGLGWLFTQRKKSRMLVSGRNYSKKQENWGETDLGIARITSLSDDRLTFMDRIILTEIEAINTEVIYPKRRDNGELFSYTTYSPLKIEDVYLFNGFSNQLEKLSEDIFDLTMFESGVLKFKENNAYVQKFFHNNEELAISIRYTHNPCYHILDVNRDLTKTRDKNCVDGENMKSLPLSYLGKKAQFIFDKYNLSGQNIINQ